MKKSLIYSLLLAAMAFTACDPIEDRLDIGGAISADDLELSATPIVVDGLNSNEVIVENNSPTLSRWVSDRSQIQSSYGIVIFDYIGTRDVQFTARNANGDQSDVTLTVEVDTMTNLTSSMEDRLGIEYNEDGSLNKDVMPYYLGNADYNSADYVSIVQEGDTGNKLTLVCEAPYLCNWTFGTSTSAQNKCELLVTNVGTYTVSLDVTKADGTVIEDYYTQEIVVESLTTVPEALINIFGNFLEDPTVTKTWRWASEGKVWDIGPNHGFLEPGTGWWSQTYEEMAPRQDGTMTFSFADMSLTKVVTQDNGDTGDGIGTHVGSVNYDLVEESGYSVGNLYLDGITILYGINVNGGNAPYTTLSIVSATENTLILGGDESVGGSTWLYKFEAVVE